MCTAAGPNVLTIAAVQKMPTRAGVSSKTTSCFLQGVTSMPECKFQLMAAFGIPADTQDMSPLYAWMRRNADMPFGLIMHNVDGMLKDGVKQQFRDILALIVKVRKHTDPHRRSSSSRQDAL